MSDDGDIPSGPLQLRLSRSALISNWRWLRDNSHGAACGAAIKADGYGLGARQVASILLSAGCRDFFVATWAEAEQVADVLAGANLSVLHGVRAGDMPLAHRLNARPVLNSVEQVRRWLDAGGGDCDVMIDTGINRLGLSLADIGSGVLDGLTICTVMSHLASADADSPQNAAQLALFQAVKGAVSADRYSMANSAGICLGSDYCFDLTRPGLALYGGTPRREAIGHIKQVAFPVAEVLQLRTIAAGDHVGYNATWMADSAARVATINMGYADGYLRGFSNKGSARFGAFVLPVIGRVSMDLVTLQVPPDCAISEGDRVAIDYDLASASLASGLSQYELLTGLGSRYDRVWF